MANNEDDDEEYEEGPDFIKLNESILIHLENGEHRIGEYLGDTDYGLMINVEAKTEIGKPPMTDSEKLELANKIDAMSDDEVFSIYKKYNVKDFAHFTSKANQGIDLRTTTFRSRAVEVEATAENNTRKSAKWLRHLKIPIRTIIIWHNISMIEAAADVYSENEVHGFSLELEKGFDSWK